MPKPRKSTLTSDFTFFLYLKQFYQEKRGTIRRQYKGLTKIFLDYNDPDKGQAYLRRPQFEALEMYVFLKEGLNHQTVREIFQQWYQKEGVFEGREGFGIRDGHAQLQIFNQIDENTAAFDEIMAFLEKFQQAYPNYIFALTMGLGKTILMGTCIFYEFLLANKFPKDERFCHNALVFAPDKTVLQSLREIMTFDKSLVVPPAYVNWLDTHLKFHFMDQSGASLNTTDRDSFNVVISNTQKIILKKKQKEKGASSQLFDDSGYSFQAKSTRLTDLGADFYDDEVKDEADLQANQRFHKLLRLPQLGIYVDEAHHAFGNKLAQDMGLKQNKTSLRLTINELAAHLKEAGTRVVGCFNYTGTPYVGKTLLPEVVYAYGLKDAIDQRYLKQVRISAYENPKSEDFIREVVHKFWEEQGEQRYEGMLPKLALFAATIEELTDELRPALEAVLADMGIPTTKILVNVGDTKLTSNDDLREFQRLDSPQSEKQFILLVNKGKEGWNCRSLFGVGLHRKPKSKVFVLQAAMRCLRQIGETQPTARVFLSEENKKILDAELESNFRISINDLSSAGDDREEFQVRVLPPPRKVKLHRVRKLFRQREKQVQDGIDLQLDQIDPERYQFKVVETDIRNLGNVLFEEDLTYRRKQRSYSALTLVSEVARYLNLSPLRIEALLRSSQQGVDDILAVVNAHNEVLYDWVIPRLFGELFEIREYDDKEEYEVELVKEPPQGYYTIKGTPEMMLSVEDETMVEYKARSFHLDRYLFDSQPELQFFRKALSQPDIKQVYFTGMLTHGQSDFYVRYIDPESQILRTYYPDFLIEKEDGRFIIVEVKGDHQVDDSVVVAKQIYAQQMAAASQMEYRLIKGSEAGHTHI